MDERARKILIGDILEYVVYEEADLTPLSLYELSCILQRLMDGVVK